MATRPTKKPAAKKTITLMTGIDVEVSRIEALVDKIVTVVEYHQPRPKSARVAGDDLGLSD